MGSLPNFFLTTSSQDPKRNPTPLRKLATTGPIPMANPSARMPAQRAAMKCPSSCRAISSPKPRMMSRMLLPVPRMSTRWDSGVDCEEGAGWSGRSTPDASV